jgi:hypothetical protein
LSEKGRIQIIVTSSLGSLGALLRVTRQHPSGITVTVRGMDFAPLAADGTFLGYDYEMPVGLPVVYVAEVYADPATLVASSTPGTATWVTATDWLKDPLEPSRNMQVQLQPPGDITYTTPSGVHNILGRPDPIVVTTIRQAATGQFQFYTASQDERDRMHYITASGNVLLLQSNQVSGIGSMYLAPLTVAETPITVRDDPARVWTISYQEVGSPAGQPGGFNSWQDVVDQYGASATWQDLADANPGTWLDFITSFDATPQPIVTWRGA